MRHAAKTSKYLPVLTLYKDLGAWAIKSYSFDWDNLSADTPTGIYITNEGTLPTAVTAGTKFGYLFIIRSSQGHCWVYISRDNEIWLFSNYGNTSGWVKVK